MLTRIANAFTPSATAAPPAERPPASEAARSLRVAVLVPTTGGTALICKLEHKPMLERCKVTRIGDFRAFPIEKDYHRMVEGSLRALGDTPGSWHLSLSDRVETGRSWEMPVLFAHRAVRHGAVLTGEVEEADLLVFATGSVDAGLDPAGEVRFVPQKLQHAAPTIARLKAGAQALFILGAGGEPSDRAAVEAAAAARENARAVVIDRFADLEALVVRALGGADETGAGAHAAATGRDRGAILRRAGVGLGAAALVAAIAFGLSIVLGEAFRAREDALSMLALDQLHAPTRDACIEAKMNGDPLAARPFPVGPDGVTIPPEPVTCGLRLRNVGRAPVAVRLDQGFAGLVIPGVSPLDQRLTIVNGTFYDVIFHTPPAGRRSVLTVFADGDEGRMPIRIESPGATQ